MTERLQQMDRDRIVERIWRKDHTVWKDDPTEITDRLGWLTVSDLMHERIGELGAFADHAAAFWLTIGGDPERALRLARQNLALRQTPRARALVRRSSAHPPG